MKKEKLITILGPTASGKTELGIYLAKKLGSSVISGDAFQVYKGMDIGTAKVTPEEAQGVTHYLVDDLDATEPYSAAIFQEKAKFYITEENKKGKIPILVGGAKLLGDVVGNLIKVLAVIHKFTNLIGVGLWGTLRGKAIHALLHKGGTGTLT